MADDLRAQLQRLLDQQRIIDAVHDYCHYVDTCSFAPLAQLFAPDAVLDYGRGQLFHGRDELDALFRSRLTLYTATNHHCSTTKFVALEEDVASTVSYVYAFHHTDDGDGTARHLHVWGHYEDEWRRDGERWLITERRIRVAGAKTTDADALPDRFEPYARFSDQA